MSNRLRSLLPRSVDPSFILGAIATVAYYWTIHQPSMHDTLLYRYTTEHAVEYVIVALFLWGLIDITMKLLAFPRDIIALRENWLPARSGREPVENAVPLLEGVDRRPAWLRNSRIGRRLHDALTFVVENKSAAEFRENLQYLSDQDHEFYQSGYMLIRFVVGVTPVLGFLGTVVHFGTALSGLSFDEMTERLPIVVGEMGAAFNTTTVALGAAMTMMFSLFLLERIERGIGRSVDRFAERELLHRFDVRDAEITPFLSVVSNANDDALRQIEYTLRKQVEIWGDTLQSLFERFDRRQGEEIQNWQAALENLQQRHEQSEAVREERLNKLMAQVESQQDRHLARIQTVLERAVGVRDDFAGFFRTIDGMARGEGKLLETQTVLTNNLRVLHETQKIDEALHGLTAAIHLLTARHRQTEAREAA
jgi:biopolymer transport protein ExbB/TolQ